MTALILYTLLWLWDHRTFDSITKANERKILAEKAYLEHKYKEAAFLYDKITYGSIFSEPSARLNLAHSYYKNGELDKAFIHYHLLKGIDDHIVASIANCQLALIQIARKDTVKALNHLRVALQLESANDLARANYIILKSAFSGKEVLPESDAPKKAQRNSSATMPEPPPIEKPEVANEVQESARKEQLLNNLKAMNMSEEQARTILDAMKSNESQYIYQLRRKQYAKKVESNKQTEW